MIMSHRLALAGALVLSAGTAVAQIPAVPGLPIRMGFEVGANSASVGGSDVSNISSRTGLMAGATLTFSLPADWAFRTGALYSMKGWQNVDATTGDNAEAKVGYIEVPVLLTYEFRNPSPVTPYLGGGAGFSIRSSCNLSANSFTTGSSGDISCADAEKLAGGSFSFKSFDTGAIGAGGVSFQLGAPVLSVGARYEYGLTAIMKNLDAKNRVLTFTAGLSWPL